MALEELPSHEGMGRPYVLSGDCKSFNENLKPLRRYLERQVGRPWNKVYSEISRHLRADNTVQQHVRDHLRDFVAVKPRRRSGALYRTADGKDRLWYQPLYVDPRDGLLKRTDRLPEAKALRRARRRAPEPASRIALATDRELRCIAGIWYAVTLAPLPPPEYRAVHEIRKAPLKGYSPRSPVVELEMTVRRLVTPAERDVITGAAVPAGPEIDDERSRADYKRAYPDRRYSVSKRALSRGELKRHGLRNSPPED
jgi:hypothetical protein